MSNKNNGRIRRLGFLAVVVGIGAALSLAGFAPALAKSPRPIKWMLQSCWTAGDFHQTNPKGLAQIIERIGKLLKITTFSIVFVGNDYNHFFHYPFQYELITTLPDIVSGKLYRIGSNIRPTPLQRHIKCGTIITKLLHSFIQLIPHIKRLSCINIT